MKNLILFLLAGLSLSVSAQKIGGFYSGTLINDSAKMVQKYELALDDYRGKITGYSYVTFVIKDTFYYGIRKVKGTIVGDSLIVKDDEIISNNFPQKPDKGVGRIITIPLNGQDSLVVINGTWKTNRTKKFYSVPGAIDLSRSVDSSNSPLINHLKELNIIPSAPYQANYDVAKTNVQPEEVKESRESKKKKKEENTSVAIKEPAVNERTIKEASAKETNDTQAMATNVVVKEPSKKEKKKEENKTAVVAISAPVNLPPAKLPYTERKSKLIQTVEAVSDSLTLAFYDNGVVDGDSISVYVNGQNVVNNARLTTVANKRIINVAGMDEINLLLVAENLGSIPPNTGLLTIRDGDNLYQINFSADMQTNASINIHRKKKQ
jgi:hypothetical protein